MNRFKRIKRILWGQDLFEQEYTVKTAVKMAIDETGKLIEAGGDTLKLGITMKNKPDGHVDRSTTRLFINGVDVSDHLVRGAARFGVAGKDYLGNNDEEYLIYMEFKEGQKFAIRGENLPWSEIGEVIKRNRGDYPCSVEGLEEALEDWSQATWLGSKQESVMMI